MTQGLVKLTMEHYEDLKNLVWAKGGKIKDLFTDEMSAVLRYRHLWLQGMKNYYLTNTTGTHYIYGYYQDDCLVSCMTWRCDLPYPWNDGWVVGNLKSRPGYTVKSNGMIEMWHLMFEICEGKGLKRWHMVIPENNSRRYQAVADRYFKEIDSTYDYEWSIVVPPNTKPNVDWVWGTMGRILLNTEIRVRTGTKKQ